MFENNAPLRKTLLELKALFEGVDDLLRLSLSNAQQQQQEQHKASLKFRNSQSLQALKDLSNELDWIARFFGQPTRSPAKLHPTRLGSALVAIRMSRYTGTVPSLKKPMRWIRGDVIEDELVELDISLGRGSFGVVMAGKYFGKRVAIKRASFGALSAEDKENFR